jgi:hypothetical protein
MTILDRNTKRRPTRATEGEAMPQEFSNVRPEDDWRDGRMVFRRPEARYSDEVKAHIIRTPEESEALARALASGILRRRAMPPEEREARIRRLAAMERGKE